MRSRLVWLLAAPLCIAAAPAPATVHRQLAADGPRRTVAALSAGRGSDWDAVLRGIARGDRRWLALAPGLAQGTDAGASEALHAALSDALATAPIQMLALAPAAISMDRLCSVPLIEPTDAQVVRYRARRTAALSRVVGASRRRALECLRLLER